MSGRFFWLLDQSAVTRREWLERSRLDGIIVLFNIFQLILISFEFWTLTVLASWALKRPDGCACQACSKAKLVSVGTSSPWVSRPIVTGTWPSSLAYHFLAWKVASRFFSMPKISCGSLLSHYSRRGVWICSHSASEHPPRDLHLGTIWNMANRLCDRS